MKLLKQLLIGSCLFSASVCASATTISGNVTADNDFIVVHTQGNSSNVVYPGARANQWNKAEEFSFNISDSPRSLQSCSISVIAWGDGSSQQGFAGILKGDYAVYTGSGGFKAHQSNIPSSGWAQNGGPTPQQISNLVAVYGSVPYTFNNGTVASGTSPWHALSFPLASNVNTNLFRWIWSTNNLSKKTYSVFTTPCDKLVKPKPVAVNMPGEHFQCYNVKKGDMLPNETIMIEDQFGRSQAVLGKPVMLCNPSTKKHGKQFFDIKDKERHLVCYNYVKQNKVRSNHLKINNQFAPDDIVSGQRKMFCVPSSKKHIRDTKPRPVPGKYRKEVKNMSKLKRLNH